MYMYVYTLLYLSSGGISLLHTITLYLCIVYVYVLFMCVKSLS